MKKTIIALAAFAAGLSAQAQDSASAAKLAVSLDVTYVSSYVFRGLEVAGDSIQPSVEAAYGNFYAGVWYSDDVNATPSIASETDLYAGYNLALGDTFSADFGVTRYLYSGQSDVDSTEAFAGVKANVFLSPSLYSYYDFDNQSTAVIAAIGHSLPIAKLGLSVDLSSSFGFVQLTQGAHDYTYWGVGAAIPYRISETAKLTAAINYTSAGASNPGGLHNDQDQVVYSLGLSVGF